MTSKTECFEQNVQNNIVPFYHTIDERIFNNANKERYLRKNNHIEEDREDSELEISVITD